MHLGKPLGDYHLLSPLSQTSKPSDKRLGGNLSRLQACGLSPRRCHSQDYLSKLDVGVPLSEGNLDFTPLSESLLRLVSLAVLCLSFFKAFRLKADNACLR